MTESTPIKRFPFGDLPSFVAAVNHHLSHPDVTLEQYRQQIRARLAAKCLSAQRLYIDIAHWTHLRDASMGKPRDDRYVELLKVIEQLVEAAAIVVPLSDQIAEETCHQADP